AFFRDRVVGDPDLTSSTNVFQRDWLYQIYLSALVSQAARDNASLAEARDTLRLSQADAVFPSVMDVIFRMQEDVGDDPDAGRVPPDRLRQRLLALLGRPDVVDRLHTPAAELWAPDPVAWGNWLSRRANETLGEAILTACLAIAPERAVAESLLLDL